MKCAKQDKESIMHLLHLVQILKFLFYFDMICLSIVAGTTANSEDKVPPKDKTGTSIK